jgi:peptidoglycan/xylan/chitin deacetylase (PgdA/CDA1 family)
MVRSRSRMKNLALSALKGCGGFALARHLTRRLPRILMYHNFTQEGFREPDSVTTAMLRKQFLHLGRHFRVVPLRHVVEQLAKGQPFDDRMVVITVDDGRRNCYELLFPLLKEFGFPVTFYVVSSLIRGENWLWTDKVLWLSEQPGRPDELSSEKLSGLFGDLNRLRPSTRDARIQSLAARAGCSLSPEAPPKYQPCSWTELREMADSGLVEIGSHTTSHPILASITDEESWKELVDSRAEIEARLGRPVSSFCFPNGQPADYRSGQLEQVKRAGYSSAVVTRFGLVPPAANPYELPRIGVSGHTDSVGFAKYLDGVEHYQAKLPGLRRQGRT